MEYVKSTDMDDTTLKEAGENIFQSRKDGHSVAGSKGDRKARRFVIQKQTNGGDKTR